MIRAALLLIVRDGKILFVHRPSHRTSLPDKWSLPSERIIADEEIKEAIERCAWHELAIRVELKEIIDEYHYKDEKEDKIPGYHQRY